MGDDNPSPSSSIPPIPMESEVPAPHEATADTPVIEEKKTEEQPEKAEEQPKKTEDNAEKIEEARKDEASTVEESPVSVGLG